MKIWKNVEVKDLFEAVEDCKKRGEPLKLAFVSHANKYSRKPNSVRNYYYKEVENLKIKSNIPTDFTLLSGALDGTGIEKISTSNVNIINLSGTEVA